MGKSNLTPREKIAKSRINLITDYPFFGSLAMKLIPRELSEDEVKASGITMLAIDIYGNLYYNPHWVSTQQDRTLECGVAHEVLHLALKQLEREGTRDHELWNVAMDAAVNEILSHSFRIPDNWVRIPKMANKCAEEIYDWLVRNAKTYKSTCAGETFDKHIFGPGEDGNKGVPCPQPGQLPFDATRAVREAYNFAKSQGKLPAGIDRLFADILNPQLDWKDILRKFIVQVIPHDFTYTRPSKKSYSAGFYMPMVKRESIELVIGVDSSGSISEEEYAEFLSEIYAMCRQFESLKATVIICDAAVQDVIEIDENFNPHSIRGRGYGGTDARPVYKYIEENIGLGKVRLLVYFTDGYITVPEEEYPFPTLWIVTKNGRTDEVEKMKNAVVIQIPKNGRGRDDDDY